MCFYIAYENNRNSSGGKFGFHVDNHSGKSLSYFIIIVTTRPECSMGGFNIKTLLTIQLRVLLSLRLCLKLCSNLELKFADQEGSANIPLNRSWALTWEESLSQLMGSLCETEQQRRDPQDHWTQAKKVLFEVIIPRYLNPMESEGRSVQPCLPHSDLWPGNSLPRSESPDTLCIFDSGAIWGHNESKSPSKREINARRS